MAVDLRTNGKRERLAEPVRLLIVVDGSGIYDNRRRLDYGQLYRAVKGNRRVVRACYYMVVEPQTDASKFSHMISQCGFEVIRRVSTDYSSWDVAMALDIARALESVDVVALVTCQERLLDVAAYIRAQGKAVENWTFANRMRAFKEVASYVYPVDEFVVGGPGTSDLPGDDGE